MEEEGTLEGECVGVRNVVGNEFKIKKGEVMVTRKE